MRVSLAAWFGIAIIGCLASLEADPAQAASPPPPRERQEIQAVLDQAPAPPPADALRPLEIVLVANRKDHGPNEHDYPRWMERWKVLLGGKAAGEGPVNLFGPPADTSQGPPPGAAGVRVQTASDWPSPEQWARADLVVAFFGTGGIWNGNKLADLKAFLERGGGFVAVHSAVIAEAPIARPLAEWIGLAWEGGYTLFRHGPVDLKIVDREHPICKGLPEQIHFEDETYWPLVGDAAKVGLLATADEKAKDTGELRPEPMFWTCSAGKGRVYSTILGHYTWTFDDPYFRILLLRGMAWAAGESPYRFDPLVLCGARTSDQRRAAAAMPPDAPPVAPDPNDPDLLLWLDAADAATLTVDGDGCVSAWSNKAASVGRSLTASAAQRPLLVAPALGGRAALRFDGVDDVLRDTGFGQSAPSWTIVLVATPRSNAGFGAYHALLAANQPGLEDFVTGLNIDLGPMATDEFSALNLEGAKDSGAANLRTEVAPFGEGQIIVLTAGSGRSRLWINGTEEEGRAANDAVTRMDELRIGGRFYWGQERGFFHGDVSEVLIYRTELTDARRNALFAHLLEKYGSDIKQPAVFTLEQSWDCLPAYDWGQSRHALRCIDEAIRHPEDAVAFETLEPRLLEALTDPSATVAAKDFACRRLAIVGTAASTGALGALLGDEKLAPMACLALERIPDSAADEVLRQALGRAPGSVRVGVIKALGNRRCEAAAGDLAGLLHDADLAVREAAAAALGKIGGPAAGEALAVELGNDAPGVRAAVADSCLKCAEQLRSAGKTAEAAAICERLRTSDVPEPLRIAAVRGLILARGIAGVPLLLEQLASDDPRSQTMALLLIAEIPGEEMTATIASQLASLPGERQARAMAALADRADKAAVPQLLEGLKCDQPAVRLAAVQALGRLGDASVVPVLLAAATSGEPEAAEAAIRSLAALAGDNADAAILAALDSVEIPAQIAAIEVLGRRACASATETLTARARGEEPAIRLASIQALGETASAGDVAALTEILVQAGNAEEMAAAEASILAICERTDEAGDCAKPLVALLPQAGPAAKSALLRALGRIGGAAALQAVQAAASDADADVQDAAIRTLCDWPGAEPADALLQIVRESGSEKHRLLALRGYLRMAGREEVPQAQRLAMGQEGLRLAQRDEERISALGVLAGVPSVEALAAVVPCLDTESLREEAGAAAVAIGEKLSAEHAAAVSEAMEKVIQAVTNEDLIRRATEIRERSK